jgi:hypothetical protein
MTLGGSRTWGIGYAQKEAKRLKSMTDRGIDPRPVIADRIAAKKSEAVALSAKEVRETVTLGMRARRPLRQKIKMECAASS